MPDLPHRIALIYDRVNKWGGAERVLLTLHDLFPRATLFTSVYQSKSAKWAQVFHRLVPTFLQRIPLARRHHELFPWLTPLAFESLNLADFDLVISLTSADAKAVITPPSTLHICYCLTPTRYLWSHYDHYRRFAPAITAPLFSYLKRWDKVAASRPDLYLAISRLIQLRLKNYYSVPSQVVYPPVDTLAFAIAPEPADRRTYFLWVGRFVSYKNPLEVIRLFNHLPYHLIMVGSGSQLAAARRLARPNIHFPGQVSDSQLRDYYARAKALIMFHQEDFGLVGVEAMAAGTPVITQSESGIAELVIPGITGLIISATPQALASAVIQAEQISWNYHKIHKHARTFSQERFKENFVKVLTQAWTRFKNTSLSSS